MRKRSIWASSLSGICAGAVNGFFGAGGGMVLVPMLGRLCDIPEAQVFPASIRIMLPICLVSLWQTAGPLPWGSAFPYLAGSLIGGILAALLGKQIPVSWLHRILGILIIWGGVRMLWT